MIERERGRHMTAPAVHFPRANPVPELVANCGQAEATGRAGHGKFHPSSKPPLRMPHTLQLAALSVIEGPR